jgi:hypothetical protein
MPGCPPTSAPDGVIPHQVAVRRRAARPTGPIQGQEGPRTLTPPSERYCAAVCRNGHVINDELQPPTPPRPPGPTWLR